MKKWILLGLSLLLTFGFMYSKVWLEVSLESETFVENGSNLDNPERGWTYGVGFYIDDGVVNLENIKHIPNKMPQYLININFFRHGKISENGLLQIESIFQKLKDVKEKAIIRFVYDWDGNALDTEPQSFDIILNHIDQLVPICNKYSEQIYVIQGLMIGNHGEMHHSSYMTSKNMKEIFEHFTPTLKNNFLSVRTPAQWRILSQEKMLSSIDSIFARLGLFNDGLMGSGNDIGTYGDIPMEQWDSWDDKMEREDEIAFQNQLCQYVPNGGESGVLSKYTESKVAIPYMNDIHISYLAVNSDIAKRWYDDSNSYQYITDHLGYRFTLENCNLDFKMGWQSFANICLFIKNTGFANMYYEKESQIILKNIETSETTALMTDDTVSMKKNMTLNFSFNPYKMEKGRYEVYFKMQDKELGRTIYFANEDLFDSNMNGYLLGHIEIK